MNRENIEADLFSFGILAMTVRNTNESREFIDTLDKHGLRLNAVIMSSLFGTPSQLLSTLSLVSQSHRILSSYTESFGRRHRVSDMIALLQIADRRKVRPDGKMLQSLESFYTSFRNAILKRERRTTGQGEEEFVHRGFAYDAERGFKSWNRFCDLYKDYLVRTEMEMPAHPWKQFLTSRDIEVSESVPAVEAILQMPYNAPQK